MRITEKMVIASYETARAVYQNKQSFANGVENLVKNFGMNEASAKDYILNLQKILKGEPFKRTMNLFAAEYYLNQIYSNFAPEFANLAKASFIAHIQYYEKHGNGKLRKLSNLLENF